MMIQAPPPSPTSVLRTQFAVSPQSKTNDRTLAPDHPETCLIDNKFAFQPMMRRRSCLKCRQPRRISNVTRPSSADSAMKEFARLCYVRRRRIEGAEQLRWRCSKKRNGGRNTSEGEPAFRRLRNNHDIFPTPSREHWRTCQRYAESGIAPCHLRLHREDVVEREGLRATCRIRSKNDRCCQHAVGRGFGRFCRSDVAEENTCPIIATSVMKHLCHLREKLSLQGSRG